MGLGEKYGISVVIKLIFYNLKSIRINNIYIKISIYIS